MATRIRIGAAAGDGTHKAVLVFDEGACYLDEAVPNAPHEVQPLIADWGRWAEQVLSVDPRQQRLTPLAEVRWAPPVAPAKILCVGSNYHDHIAEMDGPAGVVSRPAPFPFSFLKPATSLVGSGQAVAHPSYGRKLDWEAELAVVIGDPAAALGSDPLQAVFGYTILNDLSLRDFIPFPHALGLDALVSKGFDGAAPIGPWITLAADVPDPGALRIELRINGELMQDSSTAQMIFDVAALITHYARVLTLEPGDVIATGTPAGVGAARQPPRYLSPGDEIEATVGDLGTLKTQITAPFADDPLSTTIEVTA